MKPFFGLCICLAAILAVALAQRGNFRQFNNNFNNNFRPNNNFQQNNRQFNSFQQPQQRPQQQNFEFGLDTSDGRYAKFNGPVKGLPHGHGGGRYGAADCLLCPNGF